MDHQGLIQAGGAESGNPWTLGVCTFTADEVILTVNSIEVGRYPRSSITFTRHNEVYSLDGAGEPIYFHPADGSAFAAAVSPAPTTADRIAQAAALSGAAGATPSVVTEDQPIWRRWWFIAAVVVVGLGVIAALGSGDPPVVTTSVTESVVVPRSSTSTADISTTSLPATTTTVGPTTTTAPSTTTTAATTTVPEREIAFGDGIQIVGEDAQPGVYETGEVGEVFGCYWERLSGLSGDFEEILANNIVVGHDVVEIMTGDVAFDSDCGGWYVLEPLVGLLPAIPVGKWMVGAQIAPGSYEAPGSDACYWERLSGVSGELDDIITNDLPSGRAIVEIAGSDVAFNSRDCGDWTPRP